MPGIKYPMTKKINQQDIYHGKSISDPYRWLEDTDSKDVLEWIQAQNRLTFGYLEKIPERMEVAKRLETIWDFPKATAPIKRGLHYFQFRNSGLQNQDVLYCMTAPTTTGKLLLDPNTFSEDGTISLNNWSASKDGKLLAYATSQSGSDWITWRVRRVEDGIDLPDIVEWSKFSDAAWLPDGSGFYYARYDAPESGKAYEDTNYNQKVYLHKLGELQAKDQLIYARPDKKEWGFSPEVTDDGRFLILTVWEGTDKRNRLFYQELNKGDDFIELIPELEAAFEFIGNDGPIFYLLTDLDAPRQRLIALNTSQPDRENWQTLIPETVDRLLLVKMINEEFVAIYLQDASTRIKRYELNGKPIKEISLPALGAVQQYAYEWSLSGDREGNEAFFTYASFIIPPSIYRYDFEADQLELIYQPTIKFGFDKYKIEQVFVKSKDGTQIPLFLTYAKDLLLDGSNPTLLYGYGGFDISLTPTFTVHRLAWLEMGGIFAQAVLRGGGEYGEDWHQAGMIHKKQNVFDDFIACAEYLVEHRYTSTPKLAIEGRSNGGLLVGACLTQRPDLYGAALPAVGVLDMLRFHKFTIGWAWVSDYGSPEIPEEFKTLYAYSPLHNIKPGTRYPATLITTADHDDRVVPGHSFKFAAALQDAQAGEAPTLIRIQTKAGHGFGKPTKVLIDEQADIYAFLIKALKMKIG